MRFRSFIFDMGGVVCDNAAVVPHMANYLEISEENFYRIAGKENLCLLYAGLISVEAFWSRFSKAFGREVTEDLWERFFQPQLNREVVELIMELKTSARVVVGTNTIDSHYALLEKDGYYSIFDAVYASNKMGVVKPDSEFYEHILQAEGWNPGGTVFIDDREPNVMAARDLGFKAILFENISNLNRELARL
ncbi:MAG: HAD family hydrolase [Candidatus Bipolaricaulia bacterium]